MEHRWPTAPSAKEQIKKKHSISVFQSCYRQTGGFDESHDVIFADYFRYRKESRVWIGEFFRVRTHPIPYVPLQKWTDETCNEQVVIEKSFPEKRYAE